ncbi:unnamed protein product [Brassica rapa subsp. trilocularis]
MKTSLICLLLSLVWATSILWQASVPLGISRLLLSYSINCLCASLSLFSFWFCLVSLITMCAVCECVCGVVIPCDAPLRCVPIWVRNKRIFGLLYLFSTERFIY